MAGVADLGHYDLRQTFAARLVERGVKHYLISTLFLISALLGRSAPLTGFGRASRVTPGYAHAGSTLAAVESLRLPRAD